MFFLLAIRLLIALVVIYCGATLFLVSSEVWNRSIDGFAPSVRTLARSFNKGWFLLNVTWLIWFIFLGLCVLVKPSLALPALIGLPLVTGIVYLVTRISFKPKN